MCDTRGMNTSSLEPLASFRQPMYQLFTRRRDALFDLTDALLITGPTLSPAHLSLASSFQRGWGSVYDALVDGQMEGQDIESLLAQDRLEAEEAISAVDARSVVSNLVRTSITLLWNKFKNCCKTLLILHLCPFLCSMRAMSRDNLPWLGVHCMPLLSHDCDPDVAFLLVPLRRLRLGALHDMGTRRACADPASLSRTRSGVYNRLLPVRVNTHRFGGGRPRVPDRDCADAILFVLRTGCECASTGPDRVVRAFNGARVDAQEWVQAGVFLKLWQTGVEHFDELCGIEWDWLSMDGAMTKARALVGEKIGPNPTDRGKGGVKRSLLTEGHGVPIAVVIEGANRHEMKLLGFGFTAHVRPRTEEAQAIKREAGFKARRWVVEKAQSRYP